MTRACIQDTISSRLAFRPSASRDEKYLAYKTLVCKIPLLARRTRPSARATIGYLVYKQDTRANSGIQRILNKIMIIR